MNLSHTVDAVTAHNSQTSHVDKAVLNDGHSPYLILVVRITLTDVLYMTAVDFLDNHVNTRQQFLEHISRPCLQSLRHNRMVGVADGVLGDGPCFAPLQTVFINENTHELGHSHSRMGIVDMNGNLLAELADIHARLDIVAHDTLHAGRGHEVFLNQAHFAAFPCTVVGVKITGDTFDKGTVLVLLANLLLCQVAVIGKVTVYLGIPEAQVVYGAVMIADNRHIIGNSHDNHGVLMHQFKAAVRHFLHVGIAVEFYVDGLIRLAVFPGKAVFQPVVGDFYLVAVDDFLLKQAILITDRAAMSRQVMRRHGINEAGSQPAQAAVAQTGIRLFLINLVNIQLEVTQNFLDSLFNP